MVQQTGKPVIDFSRYIMERTRDFTGREWVFQAVNDWLADSSGSRFFLLSGEPGSGKTAIASRLTQFAQGTVTPPDGLPHLAGGFLGAVHFCLARDSQWITPHVFVESLATQLAEYYPAYAVALAEKSGDRQVRIEVQQRIEQGSAIGVIIHRLDVSGVPPEDAFNHTVREPLEALLQERPDEQVIILIDALDEALTYSGVNVVSLLAHLERLPAGVRFLLTSRQDVRVANQFWDVEELDLSSSRFDRDNQEDVHRYVQRRLGDDRLLAEQVAHMEPVYLAKFVETITHKAEGNFLYVRFLLDAMARGLRSLTELEGLPEGLDVLYYDSLERVVRVGKPDWLEKYAPLMGVLSVAQESLTLAQLQAFTGQVEGIIRQYLNDLQQFIEEVKPQEGKAAQEARYRLYHQSVIDFLHHLSFAVKKRQLRNSFYLPEGEWHERVAQVCEQGDLSSIWKDVMHNPVEQGRREYARRYYLLHLYQAQQWQRLFAVLDNQVYGRAKVRYDPSIHLFAQDLDLGRRAAAWDGWGLEGGVKQLPRLWRYTLLRCSLANRVDRYPEEAFRLLVLLGRKQEALWGAEMLTNPIEKVNTLLQIAEQLQAQGGQEREWHEVLIRATEIVHTLQAQRGDFAAELQRELADEMLQKLWVIYARAQQWEQAEQVIGSIEHSMYRARALGELGEMLVQVQQREYANVILIAAEEASLAIEDNDWRVRTLIGLGKVLARSGQWERAKAIWTAAEGASFVIENSRVGALLELGEAYAQAEQWEQAERVISTIEDVSSRARALGTLGKALAQAQQWERAKEVWTAAEALYLAIELDSSRAQALIELGEVLAKAQQWERAKEVWTAAEAVSLAIEFDYFRMRALEALGEALAEAEQWEWAEQVSRTIEENAVEEINTNWRTRARQNLLGRLANAYAQARQWEQAERVIHTMEDFSWTHSPWISRTGALQTLAEAYAQARQWEQAERVIGMIGDSERRLEALWKLGEAYAQAQQWEQAERVLTQTEKLLSTTKFARVPTVRDQIERLSGTDTPHGAMDEALRDLVNALAQTQQWEQALQVIKLIEQSDLRAEARKDLAKSLARARQWQLAKEVIPVIDSAKQAEVWLSLAAVFVQEGKWKRAEAAWEEAEAVIQRIKYLSEQSTALRNLAETLVQARKWKRAEAVIITIENNDEQAQTWLKLATALAQAQQWKRAEGIIDKIEDKVVRAEALHDLAKALARAQLWKQAEAVISTMESGDNRSFDGTRVGYWSISEMMKGYWRTLALGELGAAYAQAEQWRQAERVGTETEAACNEIRSAYEESALTAELRSSIIKVEAGEELAELGKVCAQVQQWERAERVWTAVEAIIRTIEDAVLRSKLGLELATTYLQAQQVKRAEQLWAEAEQVIHAIEDSEKRAKWLGDLVEAYMKVEQWEQAYRVIDTMEESYSKWAAISNWWRAYIRKRVEEWTQAQQWEQVEEWVHKMENRLRRAISLKELGKAYAQTQQWEQAERVWTEAGGLIRSMENNYVRACDLCKLGEVLAQAQQWHQAEQLRFEVEQVISTIEDSNQRSGLLSDLAEAYVQVGQWEQTERIIGMIEDDYWRSRALKTLAEAYIRSHLWERAERIIVTMEDDYWRSQLLSDLAEAYVQDHLWEQAERIISTMKDMFKQEEALRKLVKAYAQAQLWEQAERIISTTEDSFQRSGALEGLGEAYAEAQLWEQAEQINGELQSYSYRENLMKAYAQAHLWEQAERTVSTMQDSYARARVLGELGEAYAEAQLWEQAERVWTKAEGIIYSVRDEEMRAAKERNKVEGAGKYWRATALGKLGKMYAQTEQWQQAERVWTTAEAVISTINDSRSRVEALVDLATIYVQACQWQRAERVSQSLENSEVQALNGVSGAKLKNLAMALVRVQHWEWAERVIRALGTSKSGAGVLSELAAEMAAAGVDEPLLHLIQRSWWLVTTVEKACQFFSMATAFIPRYPELGLAFHEAFRQADTFLKG